MSNDIDPRTGKPYVRDAAGTGQFAGHAGLLRDSEGTLNTGPDLSTHTPVDIDTKLSELYDEHARILAGLAGKERQVERAQESVAFYEAKEERDEQMIAYTAQKLEEAEDALADLLAAAEAKMAETLPYEAEFRRRGGWTRAFLTTSANGHVHKSMHCSTCNREGTLTRFAWMTEYSGADENTIVEDAGERACTTCYPSAPVDVLNRPTKMFTPDEKRKQEERAAREAAKVERDRKRIENALTPDGSEFVIYPEPPESGRRQYGERFKTERSAVIWATDHLGWFRPGDHQPDRQESQAKAIRQIAEAIATKHDRPVEFVMGELQVKADLKMKTITKKEADQRIAALAAEHGVTL